MKLAKMQYQRASAFEKLSMKKDKVHRKLSKKTSSELSFLTFECYTTISLQFGA
jgi:hypothetical protein